jgi:hypothetical protein
MFLFDHFSHVYSVVDIETSSREALSNKVITGEKVTRGIGNYNKICSIQVPSKSLPKKHEIDQFK